MSYSQSGNSMDTRDKILTCSRARSEAEALHASATAFQVVTGYFDVLQPALLEELERCAVPGMRLFAVVLEPANPILASRARAELAAALRVIDYVVPITAGLDELIRDMRPERHIPMEAADEKGTEELIALVFNRHGREREWRLRN